MKIVEPHYRSRILCPPRACSVVFFFFFQAEDGIRDLYVTGVQTCALPISISTVSAASTWRSAAGTSTARMAAPSSSRSEERRVGKGVDLGGRRIIKKKKKTRFNQIQLHERKYNRTHRGSK